MRFILLIPHGPLSRIAGQARYRGPGTAVQRRGAVSTINCRT
jgi:hypothetical protein